jgi:hypothetical protein
MIKNEARGLNDFSFGDIQSVGTNFVMTEKGTVTKHGYHLPKYLMREFEGKTTIQHDRSSAGTRVQEANTANSRRIPEVQDARKPIEPREHVPSV